MFISTGMEVVIHYEFLKGSQGEIIIKELSIAAINVIDTLHFQSPYGMIPHGSAENGLNWDDGHIPYKQLETVLSEAVAGYAHLYSYGVSKCRFLSELLARPILNFEDFGCPDRKKLKSRYNCFLPCHSYNISCATRNAHSFYKWLKYLFQTKSYVNCPQNMTRHTNMFVSAI